MSFFSEADLHQIRDDPTSVVDLFNEDGANFIAALDMPGLSDDAYMAAFCTVLAYDLVPYGDEPNTYDVTVLANAPTLACDRYVTLAWEMADLLGVPGDDGTAVGWDGGAVGNHAQWLFDDGQSQLLLDPTIGLIANGVTYDGLINGQQFTDLASFYSRDDITFFNSEVISAVEHGNYHVWDTIYYVPGLAEWQTNYAGHLGVTVDNGDGSQTIVGSLYDDVITIGSGTEFLYGNTGADTAVYHDNLADHAVLYNPDGSLTVTGADGTDTLYNFEILQFADQKIDVPVGQFVQTNTEDSFAWNSVVTNTDYAGKTIDISYHYADGSSWIYRYDTLDQFNWTSVQTITDAQANVTKILYSEDDGTQVMYLYDTTNSNTWSRVTSYLTPDLSKSSHVLYDQHDGTHVSYEYDVNNTGAWNSIVTYYTPDYIASSLQYNQDNGTHIIYTYDVDNAYSWSVLQTNYDSSFHRVSETLTNDNGTHTVLQFDSHDQIASTQMYDAAWTLIA